MVVTCQDDNVVDHIDEDRLRARNILEDREKVCHPSKVPGKDVLKIVQTNSTVVTLAGLNNVSSLVKSTHF